MECKYCGAKLRDGAKFCPKCGKKVKPAKSGAKGPKPKAAPSGGKEERKVQPAPPKEQAGMPDYIAGPGERAGMPDHVAWPGAAAAGSPVQPKKKGKGCLIGGIIGVVILAAAIAGAVFLWKGGLLDSLPDLPFLKQEANPEGEKSGEDSQGDEIISDSGEEGEGESGSEEQEDHWSPEDVELTVPGARPGDYEIIELEENENGMCTVTPQLILIVYPDNILKILRLHHQNGKLLKKAGKNRILRRKGYGHMKIQIIVGYPFSRLMFRLGSQQKLLQPG